MQTPHVADWSVSKSLWWLAWFNSRKKTLIYRNNLPAQAACSSAAVSETGWSTKCHRVPRSVSGGLPPPRPYARAKVDLGSQLLVQHARCTSGAGRARFWGPSYSCFQLTTCLSPWDSGLNCGDADLALRRSHHQIVGEGVGAGESHQRCSRIDLAPWPKLH